MENSNRIKMVVPYAIIGLVVFSLDSVITFLNLVPLHQNLAGYDTCEWDVIQCRKSREKFYRENVFCH